MNPNRIFERDNYMAFFLLVKGMARLIEMKLLTRIDVIFSCFINYIGTQTIIVVINLLNRIEINTRNSRRN